MAAIIRGHGAADDCDDDDTDDEEEEEKRALWSLFEGINVLLLMILMKRSTMIDGYGKPLRSNRNHQAVTKRIKQAEPWQRENRDRCSLSVSSSSSYLMRETMLMMGYCDEGGSLGST